jgi:transposase-like protein
MSLSAPTGTPLKGSVAKTDGGLQRGWAGEQLDDTDGIYVRVKGRWKYLYRAIDKNGATLDCHLADRRNTKAAKRFLAAALKRNPDWVPRAINTDKNGATLDCHLADRRNTKAAKRFLAAALKRNPDWVPRAINTDENAAYGKALAELKQDGAIPPECRHWAAACGPWRGASSH